MQESVQALDISDCEAEILMDFREKNKIHILQRKVWIDGLMPPHSCLRELIIGCLIDTPTDRPTATRVARKM